MAVVSEKAKNHPTDLRHVAEFGGGSFKERQREYFTHLLERKWSCDIPGHIVCIPTVGGGHWKLGDVNFEKWLDELCLGNSTTAQPPGDLWSCAVNHDLSGIKHGPSMFRAVVNAPSRKRDIKLPVLAASASLYEKLQHVSSSWPSSRIFGMTIRSSKVINWLGKKSLHAVDSLILLKRTWKHLRWLEAWEEELGRCSLKNRLEIGKDKQNTLFKILEEALEMSRPCYSALVNACAAMIGSKLVAWANWTGVSPDAPLTEEMASWFSHVHICLSPLLLAGVYDKDPSAEDVACVLLDAITSVPIAHQDPECTSAVMRILAKELAFSPHSSKDRRLGQALARLVQLVVQFRPLRNDEMLAIRDMASRRMEEDVAGNSSSRPWEIIIFKMAGWQDRWFAEAFRGPRGLSSVISDLKKVLDKPMIKEEHEWFHLYDILQILCALSTASGDNIAATPGIIDVLLCTFRPNIPKRWLIIQDRAVHIIRRIISQRPALLHDLIRLNGPTALVGIKSRGIPRGASRSRKRLRNTAIDEAKSLLDEMHFMK